MAIPNGYTRIEANKLYENVEYYIDTSVAPPTIAVASNITNYPYLDYGGYEVIMGRVTTYLVAVIYDGGYLPITRSESGADDYYYWETQNIIDGKVNGYPTLNINLTTSPEWLYVKTSNTPDFSKVKKINITDITGTTYSFDVSGGVAKKEITFTIGGDTYTAEEGMTWAEWVESDYNQNNTLTFTVYEEDAPTDDGTAVGYKDGDYVLVTYGGEVVSANNVIEHSAYDTDYYDW